MTPLKALSRIHGGNYTVQSGMKPDETREYWLIAQSFHAGAEGGITRSAQIHHSRAMAQQFATGGQRVLPVYSLVYVFEGGGMFRDDGHRAAQPVTAGDVLCLFPGIGHAYATPEGGFWNEINVEFSGPVFDAWMGAGLLDPAVPVRHLAAADKPEARAYWLQRFHEVVLPLARPGIEPTLRDTGRLLALIGEMCATWQTPRVDADLAWANRARAQLLALPATRPLDLVQMARGFGLGEQAYRKKFKRLCGITPTLFRSRHLVELASRRLLASDASIKEIAYAAGFGSEFYFSRRFKQITGVSPGEYRRRATE